MDVIWALLLVFAGGFVGGCARQFLTDLVGTRVGAAFPWGTLAVNVSGCFAIGFAAALVPASPGHELIRDFLIFGLFGGYTTVSSFALQTLALARDGESLRAGANVVGSMGLCLVAVAAGYWVGAVLAGAA